ncbi:putative retrotransposon ty3-gypsy subclass protein [Neofusicoccum parvum UCRNP2]|uniref:Putative retrotransposon ty3-gypsy subclass protein n=1 Tax=Botryosphaeria parva (strain UCR-NP2) TaxID=1287680 RepID=R1EZ33_BOTPV|nr:putative retrotransposon ty3-gypsy subclass protein [Neofusicoccum parvum UCRNP2]
MSTDELAAAKDYIEENLGNGFIEASRAPFGSPILMARKADGGFRFCVDYRRLNAATKKNKYPLPLIDETLARLTGARYFSKIDVRQAFHRIRMHEDSKDLTTFRTRYGSYRYNVLPFGLCNGPATFQQYMNEVMMAGLDDFCSVFMDDILVYSLCNYYRRFIKNYSRIAKPLTDLTKNKVAWAWTPKCEAAFQALKDAVRSDLVLRHFDPAKPIFLEVDSSNYVSGGVLLQKDEEGKLYPVAYFSKKLSDTECNYTIYDKELFAIVFTNHETLKTFMTNKQLSRRQIRWAEELAEYNFKIIPITGKRNERADALSRREQDLPVDDSDSRLTTMNRTALPPGSFTLSPLKPLEDPDLPMELRAANRTDDALTAIRQDISKYPEYSVRDGLLVFQENRLVMPQDDRLRLRLIQAAHRPPVTGHPGIQRTWELLKERYYWNGMKKAVKRYVQNCHSCKRAKYKTESYNGLLKPLPIGDQP